MTDVIARPAELAAPWTVCRKCGTLGYTKRLARSLRVCPECGDHGPLSAPERIAQLFDPGSVTSLDTPVLSHDPLEFVDSQAYPRRIDRARRTTGLAEAVMCVRGAVDGNPVIGAVMDFRFLGGSLGAAVGELITAAAEAALRERTPLLIVTASGGARMQEGALALMQMAKTSQALGQLDEAGILTISLITDPTFGGVAASFATLADVIIAEPGARLGFAGRRVIEQTIRQELPEGFQTAEFLLEHGMIDVIRPRSELRPALARLLSVGSRRPPRRLPVTVEYYDAVVTDPEALADRDPWQAVKRARELDRPSTLDYVGRLFDEFEELHGDRLAADCSALVAGMGRLDGIPMVVIGSQKGHTVTELTDRNFGMATPAGYRKAARLMRLAGKLGLPVVTFIDTPGAYPGLNAERTGQAVAIAENLRLMAGLPVPVLAVVTGEGGSGGALALGVANRVLMCENAVYSVISPEGCASILWKDAKAAPRAAQALRVDAKSLLRLGIVDGVVPEPGEGNHCDHAAAAEALRRALVSQLRELLPLSPPKLVVQRHKRFRMFGAAEGSVAG